MAPKRKSAAKAVAKASVATVSVPNKNESVAAQVERTKLLKFHDMTPGAIRNSP